MPGTVHGGSLGRWFEKLCRIKYRRLRDVAIASGERLATGRLPTTGGVYVFWWTGDAAILSPPTCNRLLELVGPSNRPVLLEIDDEWLGLTTKLPVPLYVGKNADSIAKRIGLHLLLKQVRVLPVGGGAKKAPRPTTSCQLRAGVEHLFPNEPDTRRLILDNVGVSFVTLHGDEQAANRFYLEDLTIGLMRPPLNVDIER
jgi:hypothetical protein